MKRLLFGQSLIELVLTIGLASILLPALITGLVASREGKAQQIQRTGANALLRETQEALRSIRNRGWEYIQTNGPFHTVINGSNQWELVSGPGTVGDFTQTIVVSEVNRSLGGAIVPTPTGTPDASTKRIDITISWTQPSVSSFTSTMYLTRWRDNLSYTETTQTQFNAGTRTGVTVRTTSGSSLPDDGEFLLATGGRGDWCNPSVNANTRNLPKNGVGKAISAIQGQAAAGTGENSSGVSFANVKITDTSPPETSIDGTFDGYKTNGVFTEADYAYLATDTNSEQGVIIELTSKDAQNKYAKKGTLDLQSANTNAQSIYVLNNTAYITGTNGKLYSFDIGIKSGSHTALASINLAGVGKKLVVKADGPNTYAFIAVANASTQLQIVDVTSPSSMSVVGQASLDGNAATDITVNDSVTRAYLATAVSSTKKELFGVDISTKTGNRPTVGSFESTGMDPKGVAIVPGNLGIFVGSEGIEYQVVNLTEPTFSACGPGVDLNIAINGLSSVKEADNDAYSYVISDSDPEFRIIEGGPGGGYATEGTFESQTFDAQRETADNRFETSYLMPVGTQIQFQVALADLISGSCPGTFTFVGPNGSTADWYAPSAGTSTYTAPFPLGDFGSNYSNPGQCFRYKVKMTTSDSSSTPVLYDFTINYSP